MVDPAIPLDELLRVLQKRLFDDAYVTSRLPIYYGTTSWEKFIGRFENMTADKYNDGEMMDYLMGVLKGSAYAYAESLPPMHKKSYRILKEKLAEKFRAHVSPQSNFALLSKRKQEDKEDLSHYAAHISKLCQLSFKSVSGPELEHLKVLHFVQGLMDQKVKAEVVMLGADITMEQALRAAQNASGLVEIFKCTKFAIDNDKQHLPGKVQCYQTYCVGSVIPKCHDKNIYVPNRPGQGSGTTAMKGVMRFTLQGTVGGILCPILFDTKLEVSIVSPSLVQSLAPSMYIKNTIEKQMVNLERYQGGVIELHGFVKMKLIIFDKYSEHMFLVANVEDKIVFGNNILSTLNITIIHENQVKK